MPESGARQIKRAPDICPEDPETSAVLPDAKARTLFRTLRRAIVRRPLLLQNAFVAVNSHPETREKRFICLII